MSQFRTKAIELATKATELDREEKYEEAEKLYAQAVEHFITAMKYEPNPQIKKQLETKCMEYLARAEKLKEFIAEKAERAKNPPKKPAAAGGGDGADDGAGGENSELRNALMGSIVMESPSISWDDVAGLEAAKEALQETVILPIRLPHMFTGIRKPWKGILLFGPPGTGKSYLAKAVATEANGSTFISVSSSSLVSKWQGQSERLVKELFELAREKKPCIIFVDEVDSLCGARSDGEAESSRRIKTEFLVQMNGVGNDTQGLLVLGATNIPWALDSAIRRRFERRIYIPLPDADSLVVMYKIHMGKIRTTITDADFQQLGRKSLGRSGADIKVLVNDAIYQPVRKVQGSTHFKQVQLRDEETGEMKTYWTPCSSSGKTGFPAGTPESGASLTQCHWSKLPSDEMIEPPVNLRDLELALSRSKPTVSPAELTELVEWGQQFGQDGAEGGGDAAPAVAPGAVADPETPGAAPKGRYDLDISELRIANQKQNAQILDLQERIDHLEKMTGHKLHH